MTVSILFTIKNHAGGRHKCLAKPSKIRELCTSDWETPKKTSMSMMDGKKYTIRYIWSFLPYPTNVTNSHLQTKYKILPKMIENMIWVSLCLLNACGKGKTIYAILWRTYRDTWTTPWQRRLRRWRWLRRNAKVKLNLMRHSREASISQVSPYVWLWWKRKAMTMENKSALHIIWVYVFDIEFKTKLKSYKWKVLKDMGWKRMWATNFIWARLYVSSYDIFCCWNYK